MQEQYFNSTETTAKAMTRRRIIKAKTPTAANKALSHGVHLIQQQYCSRTTLKKHKINTKGRRKVARSKSIEVQVVITHLADCHYLGLL